MVPVPGTPAPAAWGVLMLARENGTVIKERTLQGGEAMTTSNRMELLAAISALEALTRPTELTIVTDSAYVKNGITDWIAGWKRKGWRTAGQSGQECRALARLEAAAAQQSDLALDQGPRRTRRERTRRRACRAGMAPFKALGLMEA